MAKNKQAPTFFNAAAMKTTCAAISSRALTLAPLSPGRPNREHKTQGQEWAERRGADAVVDCGAATSRVVARLPTPVRRGRAACVW
jgi:hypothetical protein